MKTFNLMTALLLTALLAACTLYMDEDVEGRVIRTGEGYMQAEDIVLPDSTGTVRYKYKQTNIAINDEVESYVVKVESDTIVYFNENMPDELLPVVGETMTSSFRDKFPNGFCHKCIERTKQGDTYRCVFTVCKWADAFEVMDVHYELRDVEPAEGIRKMSAEEMYEVMNNVASYSNGSEEVEESRGADVTRTLTDPTWDWNPDTKTLNIGLEGSTGDVGVQANFNHGVEAKFNGSINSGYKIGQWYRFDADVTGVKEIGTGYYGELSFDLKMSAKAGLNIHPPVAIPIFGAKIDLVVVAGNGGLTAMPFVSVRKNLNVNAGCCFGFDFGLSFKRTEENGKTKWGWTVSKKSAMEKEGKDLFYFEDKGEKSLDFEVEIGVDLNFGLGASLVGFGGDVGVGVIFSQTFSQKVDDDKYHSAEDFYNEKADIPIMASPYAECLAGGMATLGTHIDAQAYDASDMPIFWGVGGIKLGVLKIPFIPVSNDEGYFYCTDYDDKYCRFKGKLAKKGFLGYFLPTVPYLRLYDAKTNDFVKQYQLQWDGKMPWSPGSGTTEINWKKRMRDDIMFNKEYMAQWALKIETVGEGDVYLPLEDIPFHISKPDVTIKKIKFIKAQTALRGATFAEIGNMMVRNNSWVYNGRLYDYRYVFDVELTVEGLEKLTQWGLEFANGRSVNSIKYNVTQSLKGMTKDEVVRVFYYSNDNPVYVDVVPFAKILNINGKPAGVVDFYPDYAEFKYTEGDDGFVYGVTFGNGSANVEIGW